MLATRQRSLALGFRHFSRHSTNSTQAARGSLTITATATRPVAPLLFILSINGRLDRWLSLSLERRLSACCGSFSCELPRP